jgi:hypothetical protein
MAGHRPDRVRPSSSRWPSPQGSSRTTWRRSSGKVTTASASWSWWVGHAHAAPIPEGAGRPRRDKHPQRQLAVASCAAPSAAPCAARQVRHARPEGALSPCDGAGLSRTASDGLRCRSRDARLTGHRAPAQDFLGRDCFRLSPRFTVPNGEKESAVPVARLLQLNGNRQTMADELPQNFRHNAERRRGSGQNVKLLG